MSVIPYGRQDINDDDINAVVAVLRSDFLTQGPAVGIFESTIAQYCNAKFAVAVNSATSALHLACLALDVGEGDLVWTSPITFVASANCALYCGATIDFVDIDPYTYNMSVKKLAEKLEDAKKNGKLPKVVIPVHFCGQPCDMIGIHALSQQYGFKIIEDGSHSIGSKYNPSPSSATQDKSQQAIHFEPVGNCRFSDITVFSFHPVKIVTTGEGGMSLTNDPILAKRMRFFRSHGITSTQSEMHSRPAQEIWNYQQIGLGYNYRMTDIQAALGVSQMKRLDSFIKRRHSIARRYDDELGGLLIKTPWQDPNGYSSYHLYPICIKQNLMGVTQRQVYEAMLNADILVNLHYIPVYRQPFYEKMGFSKGYCPQAELYFQQTISIPMYPRLTDLEQTNVINILREACSSSSIRSLNA